MLSSNNSFKPKPLRSSKGMAGKACHAFASTTRFGLTQALGIDHGFQARFNFLRSAHRGAWLLPISLFFPVPAVQAQGLEAQATGQISQRGSPTRYRHWSARLIPFPCTNRQRSWRFRIAWVPALHHLRYCLLDSSRVRKGRGTSSI